MEYTSACLGRQKSKVSGARGRVFGWLGAKSIDGGVGSLTDVDHTSEIDVAGIVFTIREEQNDISAGGVIRFPELI